ncbi:cytochrome ubiquinol oxidase subunit I [Aquabacterium sp.]|uniref:cytochrome ubiquinol oxidase subunit I n=1 Tax=Aquabacterium sp. TaxID=1872578 RepID=UPI003D6D1C31
MSSAEFLQILLRFQFGLSASFHYLFVPLSLGLLLCMTLMNTAYVRTGRYHLWLAARYWRRFFLLSWATGFITGYPLRWQLHDEWRFYTQAASPVLQQIFAMEGVIAPLMLLAIAAVVVCRGARSAKFQMVANWVLLGLMALQVVTILSVNAWMQDPVGVAFGLDGWRLSSLSQVLFSETSLHKIVHTLAAAMLTGAFFVLAMACGYIARNQHLEIYGASLKLAAWVSLGSVLIIGWSGHASAVNASQTQPMKFAAFEAHWKAEDGPAPLILFGVPDQEQGRNHYEVRVPFMLSLLTNGNFEPVQGIHDLTAQAKGKVALALSHPGDPNRAGWLKLHDDTAGRYGVQWSTLSPNERLAKVGKAAQPSVSLVFLSFRIMVASGLAMLVLSALVFINRNGLAEGRLPRLRNLIRLSWPLPWLATLSGWAVCEIGRQPWTVYERLPTFRSSNIPLLQDGVLTFMSMMVAGLFITVVFFMAFRAIHLAGPEREHWPRPWRLGLSRH